MNEDSEPGVSEAELAWIACQETAARWFDAARPQAACNEWRAALEIAERFGSNDPRRAASLNNVGIALRIDGNYDKAERLYRAAEQAWKGAALWVEEMRLQPRARSSLFHLRLESRHATTYNASVLAAYQRLPPAGYAITVNNLGELFEALGRVSQARELYAQAYDMRSTAMDEAESLAWRMRANFLSLGGEQSSAAAQPATRSSAFAYTALSFSAQAEKMRWIVDRPPELTDEGRLMAAVLCAQMLDRG